jgi:hypothetical protein
MYRPFSQVRRRAAVLKEYPLRDQAPFRQLQHFFNPKRGTHRRMLVDCSLDRFSIAKPALATRLI